MEVKSSLHSELNRGYLLSPIVVKRCCLPFDVVVELETWGIVAIDALAMLF